MKQLSVITLLLVFAINTYSQNNPPIAISDTISVMAEDTVAIQVLINDFDPDGDEIRVKNAYGSHYGNEWDDNDSLVFYQSNYYHGQDSLEYNIKDDGSPYLTSEYAYVYITVVENPNLPLAQNDYSETLTEVPVEINVLLNDFDPNGDELKILDIVCTYNGTAEIINDSVITYTSKYFTGIDSVLYRIIKKNTSNAYFSDWAVVYITVNENSDIPIGVEDFTSGTAFEPIEINAISNDYDLQGEQIEIFDTWGQGYELSFNDSVITYISYPNIVGEVILKYKIRETNDHTIYTDWITVHVDINANPAMPQVVNDYLDVLPGMPYLINVIDNDYNPTGDTIYIENGYYGQNVEVLSDSVLQYIPWNSANGLDSLEYSIKRKSDGLTMSSGFLITNASSNHSYEILDVNNIKAGINSSGYLFNKIEELPGIGNGDHNPSFEVPAGSGAHTIFANTLWIGGFDEFDSLHIAAERYRAGIDYMYGPISDIYDEEYDIKWIQTWKLDKSDIIYHKNHYNDVGYSPIENILSWPGNGNTDQGQADQLAPYFDKNNNGVYEQHQGDYPLIRGDQAIYFIANDDRADHTETEGRKLGIEIHGMAYAFDNHEDSVLFNTIFVHFDMYNRSDTTYTNSYIGSFTDLDIGQANNDFIGCDIQRGTYYGYNGFPYDGVYHNYPPVQGVTILGGATSDPDNQDNTYGGCDESINGLNFGNGIVDDERLGMTRFIAFDNGSSWYPTTDPNEATQYYGYLTGFWKDHTNFLYGGNGHLSSGALGPGCNYVFPGNSDTCNWGTNGQIPNGGYNQNGYYWTEETGGNNSDDRRGVGITGPFTFKPGDVQQLDLAFTVARDYDNDDISYSIDLLKQRVDQIKGLVENSNIIELPESMGISNNYINEKNIAVYPNPANTEIYFNLNVSKQPTYYQITNITGINHINGTLSELNNHYINISKLPRGMYFLYIYSNTYIYKSKFIKE